MRQSPENLSLLRLLYNIKVSRESKPLAVLSTLENRPVETHAKEAVTERMKSTLLNSAFVPNSG